MSESELHVRALSEFGRNARVEGSDILRLAKMEPKRLQELFDLLRDKFHEALMTQEDRRCHIETDVSESYGMHVAARSLGDHPAVQGIRAEVSERGLLSVLIPGTPDSPYDLRDQDRLRQHALATNNSGTCWGFYLEVTPEGLRIGSVFNMQVSDRDEFERHLRALQLMLDHFFQSLLGESYKSLQPFRLCFTRKKESDRSTASSAPGARAHFEDVAFEINPADFPTIEDVEGHEMAKCELLDQGLILAHPEQAKAMGVKLEHVILHGPPGGGKTMLAKALAGHVRKSGIDVKLVEVDFNAIANKWHGESERRMRQLVAWLRGLGPHIAIIEELDGGLADRDDAPSSNGIHEKVVGTFLGQIDGLQGAHNGLLVGTTNRLWAVDKAARRPGRFTKLIEIPKLDGDQLLALFTKQLAAFPEHIEKALNGSTIRAAIMERAHGWTGADIAAFFNLLRRHFLLQSIKKSDDVKPVMVLEDEVLLGLIRQYDLMREVKVPLLNGRASHTPNTPQPSDPPSE